MSSWRPINVALTGLLATVLCATVVAERSTAWRRASRGAGASTPLQLSAPWGAVDRCPTCHRSALPSGGLRSTHPAVPGHRAPGPQGCTACHGGQGRRLDGSAHEPTLGGGPSPFLRRPFIEARCARCHLAGLEAAPVLARGVREYLDAGCTGCHQPGRLDQGLGPDLRRLGRRSEAELRRSMLDPESAHPTPVMWSVRWRFEAMPDGERAIAALITALLAFAEDPAPFSSAWARPQARADLDCAGCHRSAPQQGAAGHRCSFLRGNQSLRCGGCHGGAAARLEAASRRECPQVASARPTCGVCHLREGVTAGR